MNAQRARQAHAIFTQALDQPAERRDAFIDERSEGDQRLADAVRRLIRASEHTTDFLETPALGRAAAAPVIPDAVGNYLVVGVLGAGGMATVYEAVQENPNRRVALKVMNRALASPGSPAAGEAALRFRLESQALARLRHPFIAQIYEAGTAHLGTTIAPFFAMELVPDALPITEFVAKRSLPLRARLEMFIHVCDAVLHGHQQGVIHRDIKPDNVLVGPDGAPKVIDFGIARTIDAPASPTRDTDARRLLGTLSCMSPEQCSAPETVDARSDVYSLGILLFQLVTDQRPYDLSNTSIPEAVRIICNRDPARASTHNPHAKGDLDAIIAKAIAKERDRRYAGPAALADDLRRHLAFLPIDARPAGAMYTLSRFARRNRAAAAAFAAALLALVLGVAVSSRMAYVASRARDQAQQRERELEIVTKFQESMLSGINVEQMGQHLRAQLTDAVAASAGTSGADPQDPNSQAAAQEELARFTESTSDINFTTIAVESVRASVLDRARASIDAQFANQPALRARLLLQLAETMRKLGLFKDAEPIARESFAIRTAALGPDHHDTLASAGSLSMMLASLGRFDESRTLLLDARDRALRIVGDRDPLTLRIRSALGGVYRRTNDLPKAEAEWSQTLALRRVVLGDDDPETTANLSNLGIIYAQTNRPAEAEAAWREVLDRRRRTSGEDSPEYRSMLGNLGVLLHDQSRFDEARPLIEQSLTADRKRFGDRHANTLTSMGQLAALLEDAGDLPGAVELMRECHQGRLGTLGEANIDTLRAQAYLAALLRKRGDLVQAAALLEPALAAQRERFGGSHPDTIRSFMFAADLAKDARRFDDALALNREAFSLAESARGADPGSQGHLTVQQGEILLAQGRVEEGQQLIREGLASLESTVGPNHPLTRRAQALVAGLDAPPR